jgi:hypothetical protein
MWGVSKAVSQGLKGDKHGEGIREHFIASEDILIQQHFDGDFGAEAEHGIGSIKILRDSYDT